MSTKEDSIGDATLSTAQSKPQGVRMGTLVAVAGDGALAPQRVWCIQIETDFYLAVPQGSPAARHLTDDGRVCLLLDGNNNEEETVTGYATSVEVSSAIHPSLVNLAGGGFTPRKVFKVRNTPIAPSEAMENPEGRRLLVQHIFSDLPPTVARVMAHRLRYQSFEPGEIIVQQGSKADRFFIVVDGEVDIVEEDSDIVSERVLTTLGPGESFGEAALLLNTPRTATVRARTPLRVLALDKHTFEQVVLLSSDTDTVE